MPATYFVRGDRAPAMPSSNRQKRLDADQRYIEMLQRWLSRTANARYDKDPAGAPHYFAVLPMLPGINHAYTGNANGSLRKQAPLLFWERVADHILSSWLPLPTGHPRLAAHYELHCIDNRDIDSVAKALIDAAVRALHTNDRYVAALSARKIPTPKAHQHVVLEVRYDRGG